MKKGFTLIELLVVVLIIGILASVALPQYTVAVERARFSEAVQLLTQIMTAEKAYHLATGNYTADFTALDIDLPNVNAATPNTFNTKHFQYSVAVPSGGAHIHIFAKRLNSDGTLKGSQGLSGGYWVTFFISTNARVGEVHDCRANDKLCKVLTHASAPGLSGGYPGGWNF